MRKKQTFRREPRRVVFFLSIFLSVSFFLSLSLSFFLFLCLSLAVRVNVSSYAYLHNKYLYTLVASIAKRGRQ